MAQSAESVFGTTGATLNLAVTASNQAFPITVPVDGSQLVLTNVGTAVTFVRFDGTVATVANALPLLPNSQSVWDVTAALNLQVIGTAGNTLYATLGRGV